MGKIDLGTITSSTKFGGSAIDNTPIRDTRIYCPKHLSQNYQNSDVFILASCVDRYCLIIWLSIHQITINYRMRSNYASLKFCVKNQFKKAIISNHASHAGDPVSIVASHTFPKNQSLAALAVIDGFIFCALDY